jgi:uncharacterized protein (DUF4415 family)
MSEKSTIVSYTLSERKERVERGEFPTRPDAPEAEDLGADFWKNAKAVSRVAKTPVYLRVDSDVVKWFKAAGKGHLTRMNAVLRAYMEARKNAS